MLGYEKAEESNHEECWIYRIMRYYLTEYSEIKYFLCCKQGYTTQIYLERLINLISVKDESNINIVRRTLKKMEENLLILRLKYNLIQDIFQQRAEITYK